MSVGGSAYNKGLSFYGRYYNVTTEKVSEDNYYIMLRKNMVDRGGGVIDFLRGVPLVRGVVSMFHPHTFISAMILIFLILGDVLRSGYGRSLSSSNENLFIGLGVGYLVVFVIFMVMTLYLVIFKIAVRVRDTWQFHGAEHKIIEAYNVYGEEFDIGDAWRADRKSRRCGSEFGNIFLITYVLLGLIPYLRVSLTLLYILANIIAYEIFNSEKSDTVPVISTIIKLGYWMQNRFITSEPSKDKMISSYHAFRVLLKAEGGDMGEEELRNYLVNGEYIEIK